MHTNALGLRVRRLRLDLGLSQQKLAQRAGVTQPRISQIERGDSDGPVPRRTLVDLADALGVSLAALVADNPTYDWLELDADVPLGGLPAGLPPVDTPLIGREHDLFLLHDLLIGDTPRLITLTGPGGVGKTHLALRAAIDAAAAFEEVIVVALASCDNAAHAISAIAHAANIRKRDSRPVRERLIARLAGSRILLLLDNVEQALPSMATFIAELLAACPRLTCLVTSRPPLQNRGEHMHPVGPLALPHPGDDASLAEIGASPAVQLFVQRAGAVVPRLRLTADNALTIASIVRRLDGMPLAIELAATHVRHYPPSVMVQRLEAQFAFPAGGPRDLPPRQQSLRAAIDWSYNLLSEDERVLFRRLAIFRGGFTTAAAEFVAGHAPQPDTHASGPAIPEILGALAAWNLLIHSSQDQADVRWDMLDAIHDYARMQIAASDEADILRNRHLTWVLSLVETGNAYLYTGDEPVWLERLRLEEANIEQALAWALAAEQATALEAGLRLAGALADYWLIDGQLGAGRAWLDRALAICEGRPPSIGQARVLVGACLIEQTQAEIESAAQHGAAGLAMARAVDDRPTIGRALLLLGNLEMMRRDYDRARSLHLEALTMFWTIGDRAWEALALLDLGLDCQRQGDLVQAARYADASLAITQAIGNRWDKLPILRLLADIAYARGDLDQAKRLLRESLALAWREGSDREAADSLSGLGVVAVAAQDWEHAARYLGAAEALYHRFAIRLPPPQRPDWAEALAAVDNALPPEQRGFHWAATSPEAIIGALLSDHAAYG